MKKMIFLVLALVLISWGQASADYSFSFMSYGGAYGVNATLLTPSNGNGPLTVSGGTGTGTGSANSGVIYSLSLLPAGNISAFGGDVLTSDNLLTPGSTIVLTNNGLVFKSNSNPIWINIWGNASDYTYFQSGPTSWYANVNGPATLTASPVPIPAAVWLLGTGLVGLFGIRRRFTS